MGWGPVERSVCLAGLLIIGLAVVSARLMRATHPPEGRAVGSGRATTRDTSAEAYRVRARTSHHTETFPRPRRQAGDLFPVLDADLILARYGDDNVQLGVSGSYRPPWGRAVPRLTGP